MKCKAGIRSLAAILFLSAGMAAFPLHAQETIVAIRHGEKPAAGLGQLTCQGLNRALALPRILIGRYGKPSAIYAPNPSVQVDDGNKLYSYVRPLATIEPTAIALGMPVNTQIGYTDIAKLQSTLTAAADAHALIFVAWEHGMLNEFARQMLKSYGENPGRVPDWPDNDYDRIYIFTILHGGGQATLSFKVEHEDLNGALSNMCPAPER